MVPDSLAESDPKIAHLRELWFQGRPSKVIYAFERGTLASTLIGDVLREPARCTHEYLDRAGSEQRTRAVRSLLVDHGLLQARDTLLARFETWLPAVLADVADPTERRILTQYARWRHLRALRNLPGPLRTGQVSWRRHELGQVIALLDWIHRHGKSLATITQHDVDRWLSRNHASLYHFLSWTTRTRHTGHLTAPAPISSGIIALRLGDEERWQLLADIMADAGISPDTKFAAGLMLMFGIRTVQIVKLRVEDISIDDDIVCVALGSDLLSLPAELAPFALGAAADRTAPRMFAAGIDTEWLYPSPRAGHHLTAGTLNQRFHQLGIDPRQARASALVALTQQLPPIVISRLTGLDISTCIAWSHAVGATEANYAAKAAQSMLQEPSTCAAIRT